MTVDRLPGRQTRGLEGLSPVPAPLTGGSGGPGALLEVRDLTIDFRTASGLIRVVDRVSFSVAEREILGVVGESGSGKTLTLLAVIRLIQEPNAVISGAIRFRGEDLIAADSRRMAQIRGRDIAMIFQDPMTALTPVYTIGWQIVEQIRAHTDLSRRAARARARELLEAVSLPDPARQVDRYPHQLSGGMRQRALIAMALSCNPALLIADEPTTALDVTVQAQILRLIERLRHDFGSAIVLITHDMGVVSDVADRVMVMYAGRIAECGPRQDVFARPGHPYTWALMRSIPPISGDKPRRLAAIPGSPPLPRARPRGCPFRPRCPFRHGRCLEEPPLFPRGAQDIACFLIPEGADPATAQPRAGAA
jgi:peptide/nickel transport system ATP-binding protein